MADIPNFLKLVNDALLFNQDGEFLYYVPEEFFNMDVDIIQGSYVSMIGVCDYAIADKNGNVGDAKPFRFPTVFLCKPDSIEKVKRLQIGKSHFEKDYRVLHFKKNDEVVTNINVPQIVDNVEDFYRLMVMTGRIPTTISYDKGHEYFIENMELNGGHYGISMQLFGILWAELCRDPKDISKLFCQTNMNDMHAYKPASIKVSPNYTSPYVALASENFDESLRAAIMIKDEDIKYSPLEKVVTG